MTDRLLVDLGVDGRVSVSPWRDGELPGGVAGEPQGLSWPLDEDALEELRWYLEDYLRAPFGVYESRGPETAAGLKTWGEAIFGAVFGPGPARDAYQRMRARPTGLQLVFRSGSSEWLGLPWELMHDPADLLPLALDIAGMDRSLPAAELGASFEVSGGRLRVLMVISRPAGAEDVGFQMIARPLVHRLKAVRGNVDLVVLRPPTLDALAATLAEAQTAGEPFQIVHFDGHGVLAGRRRPLGAGAPGMFQDAAPEGILVFEASDGGADRVPASRVAQVLAAAQVPVVVLNACQSGAVGKELEAAVATRLLRGGAASVVAMAYSVYAVAAAEFMAAFYERLFAGDSVSAAVTAGRQQLFRRHQRPSPKGDLPLADWIVPVHYLRREVTFPGLVTPLPMGEPSLEEALNRLRDPGQGTDGGPLAPVGMFTGRDGLFFALETAARQQHVIVLHGPAGTGKTELAKAFGRWWQSTGGVERPGWVFLHSFEPGLASFGLNGVIAEIGLAVFGSDFARLAAVDRTAVVEQFLRERRALLIWDNFESVRTLPDPTAATPPLDETGCQQLQEFLHRLTAGARSTVLITSRTAETWLDETSQARQGKLRRMAVSGLLPQEAADYANALLAPYPEAGPRRASRTFGELMEWLDGHPLSMRLVLPYLDTAEPATLLAGLQGSAALPGWNDTPPGRANSLPASLDYSFAHLNSAAQRLLTAVCLFQGIADVNVLGVFSAVDDVPERFRGVTRETWTRVLDTAAGVGLLTPLGNRRYRIHPALPTYLAARWRTNEPAGYEPERGAATRALVYAYAAFSGWLITHISSGEAGLAYTAIGLQQRTMGQVLADALHGQHWDAAQAIAHALDSYWNTRGLYTEADAWADRVRLIVEDVYGTVPPLNTPEGSLWLSLTGAQADRQKKSGRLSEAEKKYLEILATLQENPASPPHGKQVAETYQQLASIARMRGQLDEATDWYNRSLVIYKELGDRRSMGVTYHGLGIIEQMRGRLDEATDWCNRSLVILKELGDRPRMAQCYHQLGLVAQERGRLDEAADWFTRSLAFQKELGDRPGMGMTYHGLANVAIVRGRFDEAEDWYMKALAIAEQIGDRSDMARLYHQVGVLAQRRGRLDEADDWYERSLAILEDIGDRPGMAASYYHRGIVAQDRGRLDEAADRYALSLAIAKEVGDQRGMARCFYMFGSVAEGRGLLDEAADWYARSLAINNELENRPEMAVTYSQLGLLAEKQGRLSQALEWTVRCVALFSDVPHPGSGTGPSQLARLTHQLGIEALETCWRKVIGGALPNAVRDYVYSQRPDS